MRNTLLWMMRALVGAALVLMVASGAPAQKNKNKKPVDNTPLPSVPLPAADQIDHDIGEMLGAFQAGNIEAMHKYYSDNATFVSGSYQPPIIGWANYVAGYQQQRAAFQGIQLIRRNTDVLVYGDMAVAMYQWEFSSVLNGKPYGIRGQTTLVLKKNADDWQIVHNHTSQLCDSAAAPQTIAPQQAPASAPAQPQPKP